MKRTAIERVTVFVVSVVFVMSTTNLALAQAPTPTPDQGLAFMEGEQNIADPDRRSVQRPRVFYRRELEVKPLVIARPQ